MPDGISAEDVADAALAWLWHSRCYFAPPNLDRSGDAFRDICLRLGGRFAEEVAAFDENDRQQREQRAAEREEWLRTPRISQKSASEQRALRALRGDVYARDGFSCCNCGSTEDLTLDHILPFSLGGRATFDNLQTLCRSCNSRKGVKVA